MINTRLDITKEYIYIFYISLYIRHVCVIFFVALFLSVRVCYDSRLKFNFIIINKTEKQNKIIKNIPKGTYWHFFGNEKVTSQEMVQMKI